MCRDIIGAEFVLRESEIYVSVKIERDEFELRVRTMVSTNPPLGVATMNRGRNTFRGVPKAEIERRTNTLLQAMTVS